MRHKGAQSSRYPNWLPALVAVVGFIALWQAVCSLDLVPTYLLPSPMDVVSAFIEDSQLLASHAVTTLTEAAIGLLAGVALGFVMAVVMDTVAIAPLLVLWFGYGILPKVVLVILTTFFPITVALVRGFRSVDPDVVDLMRTMTATRWQIFFYAKLPAAAEQFFSGLRISATYAIVGAVIAEWLGGFLGLGVYMTRVRKSFAYDRMFASIILISALSLALMKGVDLLERVCMPWKKVERK